MDDPKKLVQEASGYLRKAESSMFGGKNQDAVELLNKANEGATQAAQQMPDDFQVKSLLQKIEKLRKDLERKGVATRPGSGAGLPFEVEAQLGHIRECILTKNLERAKRELEIYYSRFAGPYSDIPQIKEMHLHLQILEKEAEAARARKETEQKAYAASLEQHEALCREWENTFRQIPYFDGLALNVPGLLEQKQAYGVAIVAMDSYNKVNFIAQQSITLESLVNDLKQRMRQFESNLSASAAAIADEVNAAILFRIDALNKDTAWESALDQKPQFVGRKEMETLAQRIEEVSPLFDESAAPLQKLRHSYGLLTVLNDDRKEARSKRINMRASIVDGAEGGEAINAARIALLNSYPNATIITGAVVKSWESKHTEGWLDNTRSQWVVKNTLETAVELAAKLNDKNFSLFTMHVEKVVNPDGTFGRVVSHILFEEQMAEENIAVV
ncbi:MAG: hypothetical protein RBS07_04860 [Lentimicrobium sp.]|jgi:hypothetical protein|nr:hypothetical protein [Lentimicrobium sp.]